MWTLKSQIIPWSDEVVVVDASMATCIFIPVYLINNQLRMAMTTQTAWNEWKFLSWSIKMKIKFKNDDQILRESIWTMNLLS